MRTWFQVSFVNLILAAFLGVVLRLFPFGFWSFDFQYILHAHSHTAMLGWLYLALFTYLNKTFLPPTLATAKKYQWLFWLTQFSVLGMLFSFPFQGYGSVSIPFSTLHILLAYFYLFLFLRDTWQQQGKAILLARTSLFFLFLSTLGIWGLGPVMAGGLKETKWYEITIQFFLHFQFNGWFLFGILALFFQELERKNKLSSASFKAFYWLLFLSTLILFFLTISWAFSHEWISFLIITSTLAQLAALLLVLRFIQQKGHDLWKALHPTSKALLGFALLALIVKILMQSITVFPEIAEMARSLRKVTIGFIHLTLLGVISTFLFGWASKDGFLAKLPVHTLGSYVFLLGVISTEALLFLQGLCEWKGWDAIPQYHSLLLGGSVLMVGGVVLLGFSFASNKSLQP